MSETVTKAATAAGLVLDEGDMRRINALTQRPFAVEEVFAFRVTMADNDIDRDGEAFPIAALEKLAELFRGKTIIQDHETKAQNQVARIYHTEVVREERTAKTGEPYARLVAHCYTPRQGKEWLITDIEAGIIKEVSVSFSFEKSVCSICGKSWSGGCGHCKGTKYDGKICYRTLEQPVDAYELSFVPVPAQPAAGVTKSHRISDEEQLEEELPEMEPEIKALVERVSKKVRDMMEDRI